MFYFIKDESVEFYTPMVFSSHEFAVTSTGHHQWPRDVTDNSCAETNQLA